MGNGNKGGLGNVTYVRGGLSRFRSSHQYWGVNTSKGINHYFSFNGLHRVHDHSHSPLIEHFLWLLGLHIGSWEPWAKSGMGVIPSNTHLISANLLHHIHELLLENRIYWFYTDSSSFLGHREDVNNSDCIIIMNLSHHQAHDFKWNSSSRVLQHFQKGQRRDINLFTSVRLGNFSSWGLSSSSSTHLGLSKHSL